MMKNKDDPKTKARRIYDHYRAVELKELEGLSDVDYYDMSIIKRLSQIQHRRAFAGRVLDLGVIK